MSYNQPPPPGGYGAPQPGAYGAPQPRPAELMDRFVGRLIDWLVLFVVQLVLSGVLGVILLGTDPGSAARWIVSAISILVGLAISLGYYVFFETTSGQTLGKKAMKLKVVGPAGAPVTVQQSVKRNFFYLFALLGLIPILGTVVGGLAQIAAMIAIAVTISQDKQLRQGFHDKLANETYVMKLG